MTRKKGWKHSEETKRKIGAKSRGRKHTDTTKCLLSELHSGEGNPMYGKLAANKGKPMSKKQRKLLSKIHKKRFAEGAKVWNADKHTGQQAWNKGTKGVVKGWWKGKKLSKKHRQHLSEAHKGSHISEETKQKLRDKMLKYWRQRKKLTKEAVGQK